MKSASPLPPSRRMTARPESDPSALIVPVPRCVSPRRPRLGALEERLYVMPVGVDDEGGIVVGVVALAQAWGPVVTPPAGEGGGVEVSHRLGIRSEEGEVERAGRLTLDERQVLGVRRP